MDCISALGYRIPSEAECSADNLPYSLPNPFQCHIFTGQIFQLLPVFWIWSACFHPSSITLCLIISSACVQLTIPPRLFCIIDLSSFFTTPVIFVVISKHHHQLGVGILLFSLWDVCLSYPPSHHSFCTQVCWGNIVLVHARCTNNRQTVPSVCSVCFMVGYFTSFLLPVDWASLCKPVSLLGKRHL